VIRYVERTSFTECGTEHMLRIILVIPRNSRIHHGAGGECPKPIERSFLGPIEIWRTLGEELCQDVRKLALIRHFDILADKVMFWRKHQTSIG
jgi:hypothetical protein